MYFQHCPASEGRKATIELYNMDIREAIEIQEFTYRSKASTTSIIVETLSNVWPV